MATNKEYRFKTVKEIVDALELSQIDDFTHDFGLWLKYLKTGKTGDSLFDEMSENVKQIISQLSKLAGEKEPAGLFDDTTLVWIDDGKHEHQLTIVSDKESPSVTFKAPAPKKKDPLDNINKNHEE